MDTNVHIELLEGCDPLIGSAVRPDTMYGVKAGREAVVPTPERNTDEGRRDDTKSSWSLGV